MTIPGYQGQDAVTDRTSTRQEDIDLPTCK